MLIASVSITVATLYVRPFSRHQVAKYGDLLTYLAQSSLGFCRILLQWILCGRHKCTMEQSLHFVPTLIGSFICLLPRPFHTWSSILFISRL